MNLTIAPSATRIGWGIMLRKKRGRGLGWSPEFLRMGRFCDEIYPNRKAAQEACAPWRQKGFFADPVRILVYVEVFEER